MEMFCTSTVALVTQAHFVKTHWTMHLKLVRFLYKLYLNKVDVEKK